LAELQISGIKGQGHKGTKFFSFSLCAFGAPG
jgi:hypothetical protein